MSERKVITTVGFDPPLLPLLEQMAEDDARFSYRGRASRNQVINTACRVFFALPEREREHWIAQVNDEAAA